MMVCILNDVFIDTIGLHYLPMSFQLATQEALTSFLSLLSTWMPATLVYSSSLSATQTLQTLTHSTQYCSCALIALPISKALALLYVIQFQYCYSLLYVAPVFVDTYRANYAPRTALLPGVMDTISADEHKYFYVFVRDVDSQNVSISTTGDVVIVKRIWKQFE